MTQRPVSSCASTSMRVDSVGVVGFAPELTDSPFRSVQLPDRTRDRGSLAPGIELVSAQVQVVRVLSSALQPAQRSVSSRRHRLQIADKKQVAGGA